MNLLDKHKRWLSLKGLLLLMAFNCYLQPVQSQTNNTTPPGPVPALSRIEYYIDTDPGFGLATNFPFAPGTTLVDQVINIDPATVSAGIHRLGLRAKDSNGAWSLDNVWLFYKPYSTLSNITPTEPLPALSRIEYYIDADPGYGVGTNVPFDPGTSVVDQIINLDPATITSGIHRLGLRSRDANGAWSLDNTWLFYKPYTPSGINTVPPPVIPQLNRMEYYFDTDPGYGNGIAVAINPLSNLPDFTAPVNVTGLSAGAHKLGIRSRDANGAWSLDNKWDFTVPATLSTPSIVVNSVTRKTNCARDSFDVSYDRTGTYNAGNIFNVELSDASGSFASPLILGSYTGTGNTIIKVKIPSHYADGVGYRVRVSSTNPVVTGITGSDPITIHDRPYTQPITGRTLVNGTYTWPYTIPTANGSQWNWTLTGGTVSSGQTTNTANLQWVKPVTDSINATIYVVETNQYGCIGDSSQLAPITVYRLAIKDTVPATLCPTNIVAVKTGRTGMYEAGNNLIAELSDASGSFASPLATASLAATGNGVNQLNTINLTIPFGIPNGTGYRIRVRSSIPAFVGDTSANIRIVKPDIGADITRTKCQANTYNLAQDFTDTSLTYNYFDADFVGLANNNVATGNYYAIGINAQGCTDTAMVTIHSNPSPYLGPDSTVYHSCPIETTNMVPFYNTTGLTAVWSTPTPTLAIPGTYRLIVTNSFGCTDTAFAFVILETATWTGTLSSDWHTPGNWSTGKVPTERTHVIVTGLAPNPCIISTANAQAASIQVRNGAAVQAINNKMADVKGKCPTLPAN